LTVLGTEDEGVYAGTFSISVDYKRIYNYIMKRKDNLLSFLG
jgi:hypothetical protein